MNDLFDILKTLIPSLVVFFTAYYMIRQLLKREESRQQMELMQNHQKLITPIRLQAYERLTLFMERINPESLIIRVSQGSKNNQWLQQNLLAAIREEFEHNLSQQLYVTPQVWEEVKNAKEKMVQLINSTAIQLDPKSHSMELSKAILEQYAQTQPQPTRNAISLLKNEIKILF